MKHKFQGWDQVNRNLDRVIEDAPEKKLNQGQKKTLCALKHRISKHGVLIADEVGMGKTRIACALAQAVVDAGGRVAVVVPPGLGAQWQAEFEEFNQSSDKKNSQPRHLRSLQQYFKEGWKGENNKPWYQDEIIIISHGFTAWRIGKTLKGMWRIRLLALMHGEWQKREKGRYPYRWWNDWEDWKEFDDVVEKAAKNIVEKIQRKSNAQLRISELCEALVGDVSKFNTPDRFSKDQGDTYRNQLTGMVGLGLGQFDLIIIDEAHKSRSEASALSTLLDSLLLTGADTRRLGMTATPVELDSEQWIQILGRIGIENVGGLEKKAADYIQAVESIRLAPNSPECRETFRKTSADFQSSFSPYVLRRDKRENEVIQNFASCSGRNWSEYRKVDPLFINPKSLSIEWKQSVCAAESLSRLADVHGKINHKQQRLRIQFANGVAVAGAINNVLASESDNDNAAPKSEKGSIPVDDKASARLEFWNEVLQAPLEGSPDAPEDSLYHHPVIEHLCEKIEKLSEKDEKILVFGRFTKPMRALRDLLNARAMLRCLFQSEVKCYWPQSAIGGNKAVGAACKQMGIAKSIVEIDGFLKKQYYQLRQQRAGFNKRLRKRAEESTNDLVKDTLELGNKIEHFSDWLEHGLHEFNGDDLYSLENKQLDEVCFKFLDSLTPKELEKVVENDESSTEDENLPEKLCGYIKEHFESPAASFARLMDGSTKPETRHRLKETFNRDSSGLKVLIAQSLVGREGLNLHEACRMVILMHLEWNPGVVEQQIGRVDRLNSRWEKLAEAFNKKQGGERKREGEPPTIQIIPVIFSGTYDEHQWEILNRRWLDLRAQLHGEIFGTENTLNDKSLVKEINECAPCFSTSSHSQGGKFII